MVIQPCLENLSRFMIHLRNRLNFPGSLWQTKEEWKPAWSLFLRSQVKELDERGEKTHHDMAEEWWYGLAWMFFFGHA